MKNTISRIGLNQVSVYGNPKLHPDAADLMQGVIVSLDDAAEKIDNDILTLMNTLFSGSISAEEKKRVLKDDFKIAMTEKLESEVSEMCNLSESVREKGRAEGRAEGEERLSTLLMKLFAAGRVEDAKRAVEDSDYKKKLMKEFALA